METVWLDVYVYGNRLATKQEILDARALLESHGFEYGIESEMDKGSEFWFVM